MQLVDIYQGLGAATFRGLLTSISIGKLKSFQLFERMKVRLHLNKLNAETLARSAPRQWDRITVEKDDAFGTELAQAILVCHMNVIIDVLNHLNIPHEDGFFAKDADIAQYLTGDWQTRAWDAFQDKHPQPVLIFYLNHLAFEMTQDPAIYNPLATAAQ